MPSEPRTRNIVIIGGGVIGCSTAYFLTRHPRFDPALHSITLLEASSVASAASGKAGGLLALWAYPECLVPLSYRLHRELALEHDGYKRWGYRNLKCGTVEAKVPRSKLLDIAQSAVPKPLSAKSNGNDDHVQQGKEDDGEKSWEKLPKQDSHAEDLLGVSPLPADLDWLDASSITSYAEMGMPGFTETAQVHPYHFTNAIASLAEEGGAVVRTRAKVTKIHSSKDGVTSIEYEDRNSESASPTVTIPDVTDVIVAAGPWTGRLVPRSKIEGIRAHSVVIEADVSPYAVFTDIDLPNDYVPAHRAARGEKRKHRGNVDPEIYARPFGEVYACGKTIPLPETSDQVQCDEAQCDDLIAYIDTISPALRGQPVKAKQACYLPRHMRFGEERGPVIGLTSTPGLWIASGHTCWGIQNGPATGYLMAEMVLDGKASSADISKLNPSKFKV